MAIKLGGLPAEEQTVPVVMMPASPRGHFDIAIVGSGIAGLTVAKELVATGKEVALIESGGFAPNVGLENLKQVETRGLPIKPESRNRNVGGSSLTWSGLLGALNQSDIDGVPGLHSGWPISWADVYGEFDTWRNFHDLPPIRALTEHPTELGSGWPSVQNLELHSFVLQFPPLNYQKLVRVVDGLSSSVQLFQNSTVTSLKREKDGGWRVAGGEDNFEFTCRNLVIAAGAIESVRLLLRARDDEKALRGLPALGTHFMNHPKGQVGTVKFSSKVSMRPLGGKGMSEFLAFRLPQSDVTALGISNPNLRLVPVRDRDLAVRIIRIFLRQARSVGLGRILEKFRQFRGRTREHRVTKKGISGMSQTGEPQIKRATVVIHADTAPSEFNYIELGYRTDKLGSRIPMVVHSLQKADILATELLLDRLETWLRDSGLGTLVRKNGRLEELLQIDASHHLGGARMGRSVNDSVVDKNLEVHGATGLFVVGGAVFPTGGHANPTVTILSIARRLGLHLRGK
ncbi:GMC oxidoreductase [Pontimonas sp.]|nr:GMC oxidoreductase [Pontimonas sp.]